jgi:hypothetical protein
MTTMPASSTTEPQKRIFTVGSARIAENESTMHLSPEEVRTLLKTAYPEVAHATIRERVIDDTVYVDFLAQPGRKG